MSKFSTFAKTTFKFTTAALGGYSIYASLYALGGYSIGFLLRGNTKKYERTEKIEPESEVRDESIYPNTIWGFEYPREESNRCDISGELTPDSDEIPTT